MTPLTRHDQAPKHTEAQVTGAVTGEKITGKRVVGEIPDGTGEATVEVTYEDGSSETVKVPITVVGLPKTKVPVESFGNLTKEEQDKVKESEVVTPDEQPAETDNTTTKPKASQNILPNTGTADGLGIFSAAAASILAGLGLIIPVKKEDEEEEETQNN